MKVLIVRIAVALTLGLTVCWAVAADIAWLLGKWELSYESDNNPKDWLEFAADGKTFGITPEGRRIPGRYTLKESQIEVIYSFDGKIVPLTLRFTDDKQRLLAYSAKTKNTAQYKKMKE